MMPDVVRALDRVDWNFPTTGTRAHSLHKLHWFAGNFIPQIPATFIELLSRPGDLVLDPFGGSGTTVVEAAALGRRACQVDHTSACALIARGKLDAASRPISVEIRRDLQNALAFPYGCRTDEPGADGEGGSPLLKLWFSADTLGQLRYLWQLIQEVGGGAPSLQLIFSDLLFACASTGRALTSTGLVRRHHWGWVADNVAPREPLDHDAIGMFLARLDVLPAKPQAWPYFPSVIQGDARALPLVGAEVDLIVTSPPYVGVIDYVRAHRLLYLWMGWALDEERQEEIGARFKRKRLDVLGAYERDVEKCWAEMERVLRPGGYAAIIIGESRAFEGAALRALESLGRRMPLLWGPKSRRPTRRRVSDRDGRESLEYLAVARKPV